MSSPTRTPQDLLFSDIAGELATTRRVLERVPDGQSEWRPHDKSMTLGRLATHVAELPRFAATMFETDELDFAKSDYVPTTLNTTAERLALFDETSKKMISVIESATWETLATRWIMRMGEHIIVNDERGKLMRQVGMSHIIHHRAQLGVYLRLLGVAVPSVYGPTADEQ